MEIRIIGGYNPRFRAIYIVGSTFEYSNLEFSFLKEVILWL